MRICILAHLNFHPARDWARYLHSRGHEVSFLSLTPGQPVDGVHCESLRQSTSLDPDRTNWQHLLALPRLWLRLRGLRPALVIAMFVSSNGVLAALSVPSRCRLVQRVACSDVERRASMSPLHRRVIGWALKRGDRVISPASHLTQIMQSALGVEAGKILTLQSGISLSEVGPGLPASVRPAVCIAARVLVPHSHTKTIIDAFERLAASGSCLSLDVYHDGPERGRLEARAASLIRTGQVHFHGKLTRPALGACLGQAAVYVSATAPDGASTTLLEAMAAGAFPVLCDIPANREWIDHEVNGLLVAPGDPQALAHALERSWTDSALRQSAALYNRALVERRADFSTNMPILEAAALGPDTAVRTSSA